jgi:cell shape-determining protein MreD
MQKFLIGLVVIALILEGSLTSLPLVLLSLLLFRIATKSSNGFLLAFLAGILLDVFLVRPLGETSVYFLIVLFLIGMYEKKFEVNSLPFIMLATLTTAFVYLIIFPVPASFIQAISLTFMAGVLYILLRLKKTKKQASVNHL